MTMRMEQKRIDSTRDGLPQVVNDFFKSRGIPDGAFILVAYSGGADSTALLASAVEAGYRCRALHCNFHLRGDESDRDESFSRAMAEELGCGIDVVNFDVGARMGSTGESVEMACRELRYEWFSRRYAELMDAGDKPACVAIAHHESDNVETFFLNLIRGSGLKGLASISYCRGIFLRPLLDVAKADIIEYLNRRGLEYVEDSSNSSDAYKRNIIRNRILPSLEERLPGLCRGVEHSIENLRRDKELLEVLVERVGEGYVDADGTVDVMALSAMPCAEVMLFHMLDGALSFHEVKKVLRSVGMSGRWFNGRSGARFLLDRGRLIKADGLTVYGKPKLVAEVLPRDSFYPDRSGRVLWLDGRAYATDVDDWELRKWRHGDRMRPFGMRGSRLVSDILTDAKVSALEKQNAWVLVYRGDIVWVVGVRCSCCFAVTPESREVVRIALG